MCLYSYCYFFSRRAFWEMYDQRRYQRMVPQGNNNIVELIFIIPRFLPIQAAIERNKWVLSWKGRELPALFSCINSFLLCVWTPVSTTRPLRTWICNGNAIGLNSPGAGRPAIRPSKQERDIFSAEALGFLAPAWPVTQLNWSDYFAPLNQ